MTAVYTDNLISVALNPINQTKQNETNQQLNNKINQVNDAARGESDSLCNLIKITNSENGLLLVRNSKLNITTFILSTIALNCLLPIPSKVKPGDIFRFLIESGNPATFSATINLNGNTVNGSTSAIVIITDRVTELVCLSTGFLKGFRYDLI